VRQLPDPLVNLTVHGVNRLCSCWKIERQDGVVLRVTEHDRDIKIGSDTYVSAGGFNASAKQRLLDLKPRNLEILGFFDADFITNEDLRAGKYRGATITEIVVDHRYPWAGAMSTSVYYVSDVSHTGESWTVQMRSLTRKLNVNPGRVYSRVCDYTLGDDRCTVDLPSLGVSGSVSTVVRARLSFTTGLSAADGVYSLGKLVWTSGANAGETHEVQTYSNASGRVDLALRAPSTIAVGDGFTVYPGCDGLAETCRVKFSNLVNFGGFDSVPGTNATFKTPRYH